MIGYIYKLTSTSCDQVYYGSTRKPIQYRLYTHRALYKQWKKKGYRYYSSFVLFENSAHINDISISLVEEYPFTDLANLRKREKWWCENHPCCNVNRAFRTREEDLECDRTAAKKWYSNKENKQAKHNYYIANREKYRTRQQQYYLHKKIHAMLYD